MNTDKILGQAKNISFKEHKIRIYQFEDISNTDNKFQYSALITLQEIFFCSIKSAKVTVLI